MTTIPTGHHSAIDPADLIEIGEFCEFLHDWIATDPDTLGPSLRRFSLGLFSLEEFAGDLDRFAWLLNPSDSARQRPQFEEDQR